MAKNIRSVEAVLLLFILLLSACLALTAPGFLSWQNFFDLLNQNAVKMIFATGLVVVLIGGIDISFAVAASVVQYITISVLMKYGGGSWLSGMALACLCGAALGIFNAVLIYGFRVVSIIITIATFNLFFGLLIYFTKNGKSIYRLPDWISDRIAFCKLDDTTMLYLPVAVMLAMALITWYILKYTGFGRQLYGYGSNPEGARRAGVQEVVPKALYGWEFDVLVAVVLGGATLGGGRGTVAGALLGVFFLALLKNAMILLHFSPYAFNAVSGAVILAAIAATQWQTLQRKLRGHA